MTACREASDKSPTLELTTPVQFLKGCGAARAELLARLGVAHRARPALLLPARLPGPDRPARRSTSWKKARWSACWARSRRSTWPVAGRAARSWACWCGKAPATCGPCGSISRFCARNSAAARRCSVSGKAKRRATRWEMVHPHVQGGRRRARRSPAGQLLPVYPLTEGLHAAARAAARPHGARRLRGSAGRSFSAGVPRRPRPVAAPRGARRRSTFPTSRENLEQARRRFIYQELFMLQLALALKRQAAARLAAGAAAGADGQDRRPHSPAVSLRADRRARTRRSPRSPPTWASRSPMNRLLQGDVGSGKTIVAVYAMLLAVAHGAGRADGPHRSPGPAARRHARAAAGRQPHAAGPADRRPDGQGPAGTAGRDRRRRDPDRHRHAGHRAGRRAVRQAGTGRDRRAAQVRRAPAGRAQATRRSIRTTW